jgi:LmbE family N-acetylglucosaminyl deacetylase
VIGLDLRIPASGEIGILLFGAHSDDIEIGAGATILELARRYPAARVAWHVMAAHGAREKEARESAAYFTGGFENAEVHVHGFADGSFPVQLQAIKQAMERVKAESRADIVFTHCRGDLHQDHRTVAEVTWQTFRNHLILEYEIPKYDGDMGAPAVFVPISESAKAEKLKALQRYFASQDDKDWFDEETFAALLRLRGMECRSPSGYAEAFYCHKAVIIG